MKRFRLTLCVILAGAVLVAVGPFVPALRVYWDREAWHAVIDGATGKDPLLTHQWNVSLFLIVTTVLLFVVLDLRRVVNQWDTPTASDVRRRQSALGGVAIVLLLLLMLRGC